MLLSPFPRGLSRCVFASRSDNSTTVGGLDSRSVVTGQSHRPYPGCGTRSPGAHGGPNALRSVGERQCRCRRTPRAQYAAFRRLQRELPSARGARCTRRGRVGDERVARRSTFVNGPSKNGASTAQLSGRTVENSTVKAKPNTETSVVATLHVLRVSTCVSPPSSLMIQKPLSLYHEKVVAPAPIAITR